MDYNRLANLLYPDVTLTPEDIAAKYPPRVLPEGAKVTRFGPSPTGFVHFGSLFPAIVCERLAHQSGGVFYLRIEDTDHKREVEGAEADIIKVLATYGINYDEGVTLDGQKGDYGPYRQSERNDIYHAYAKDLVKRGLAYPCFCTADQLAADREKQTEAKQTTGYYGEWAHCRDLPIETVEANLKAGMPFVLRLRSSGSEEHKLKFNDLIKGTIDITENFIDHVIIKSDGTPPYHFAHPVDDHLMGTTHVVRGDEWLPSLPLHLQIFSALGFKAPKYMHISPLMKMDGDSKKKLSKRDLGAGVSYYVAEGYPQKTVKEYVLTLLNSNFEEWRAANPTSDINDFPFSIKKMSASGSLFDFDKMNDVSKNVISRMSADEVFELSSEWAKEFDTELFSLFDRDPEYAKRILAIGRGGKKPRKDLTTWKDVRPYVSLFYDELFTRTANMPEQFDKEDIKKALAAFCETYDENDDNSAWFDKVKNVADSLGFAADMKAYKANPEAFKGSVADISSFIRIALTGAVNSPDMCEIMHIIGKERSLARIKETIRSL